MNIKVSSVLTLAGTKKPKKPEKGEIGFYIVKTLVIFATGIFKSTVLGPW